MRRAPPPVRAPESAFTPTCSPGPLKRVARTPAAARAWAIPRSLRGWSARPWKRRSTLKSVCPWRTSTILRPPTSRTAFRRRVGE